MTTLDEATAIELSAIGEVLGLTRAIHESIVEYRERLRPVYTKSMRSAKIRARCKYCGCDATGSETAHERHCDVCHKGLSGSAERCAKCKMAEVPVSWMSYVSGFAA